MPIEVRCQCGKRLKVPDKCAGHKVACPGCSEAIAVPSLAAPEQEEEYEAEPPQAASVFGAAPRFSASRPSPPPQDDDQRYSLSEFVQQTSQQDLGQGFFELESPYMLEVNLDGMVWTRMGSVVAYLGNIKFTREGILEKGIGKFLKKAVSGEGTKLTKAEGRGSGESIQMHFQGDGFVVVQPYEEVYLQSQ